ncbi:MAG: DUF2334 domain-containing protein, partial [Eubacterium sp.]|nr:DUF2334 domain-containing protein [Eubacterium sp.]
SNTVYCNGRLCLPEGEGAKLMGGELIRNGSIYRIRIGDKSTFLTYSDNNRPIVFLYNEVPYISLYELITPFGYEMTVDLDLNTCSVVKYDNNVYINAPSSNSSSAYIRFEDIIADGLKPGGEGKYTPDMIEKLRFTAEYMYLSGQQYYIAWIPLYVYPEGNYTNDILQQYSLYNSYFIYVLDYMTDHNGHIGVHGYSHQYGNDESAVGYEWGSDTPYSLTEQQERMIKAKQACRRLGYTEEFFEFPHYDATDAQLLMAENYFDAIYQAYCTPGNVLNYITYSERTGKRVYYIPTPADYVHYKMDESVFSSIDKCIANGYALSLYFHPVIDKNSIEVTTVDGVRVWSYNDTAILPQVLNKVLGSNYSFISLK